MIFGIMGGQEFTELWSCGVRGGWQWLGWRSVLLEIMMGIRIGYKMAARLQAYMHNLRQVNRHHTTYVCARNLLPLPCCPRRRLLQWLFL